jgi:aryl-alcohol dehydrogenase-like predicted oxidoreductase
MAQVALAWAMSKDGVSAPIVGTTSLDNLKDLLGEDYFDMIALVRLLTPV